MKAQILKRLLLFGLFLIGGLFFPRFASAQGTISGDSVIYEGVVIDGATRKPWCAGEVRAMNKLKIKGMVYVDANGHFRLAVSSATAALPNLRIVAYNSCTPGGHGLRRECIYEEPAPDSSKSGMKFVVGGGCGECSCL